jgi:hypothetical protein
MGLGAGTVECGPRTASKGLHQMCQTRETTDRFHSRVPPTPNTKAAFKATPTASATVASTFEVQFKMFQVNGET